MTLHLTIHAIEQFIARWRPEVTWKQAEAELRGLARIAINSTHNRRAITGNALLYRATSEEGEQIDLAVRESTIITVLPKDDGRGALIDMTPDESLFDESRATVASCQALVVGGEVPPPPPPCAVDANTWRNAETVIREHKAGKWVSPKALRNAEAVLKRPVAPPDPLAATEEQRRSALDLIRIWHEGNDRVKISGKALRHAHDILGLIYRPPEKALTPEAIESRRRSAQEIIQEWKRGRLYKPKAVKRAHEVLGLPFEDK